MQLRLVSTAKIPLRKPQWRRQGFVIQLLRASVEYESSTTLGFLVCRLPKAAALIPFTSSPSPFLS